MSIIITTNTIVVVIIYICINIIALEWANCEEMKDILVGTKTREEREAECKAEEEFLRRQQLQEKRDMELFSKRNTDSVKEKKKNVTPRELSDDNDDNEQQGNTENEKYNEDDLKDPLLD